MKKIILGTILIICGPMLNLAVSYALGMPVTAAGIVFLILGGRQLKR